MIVNLPVHSGFDEFTELYGKPGKYKTMMGSRNLGRTGHCEAEHSRWSHALLPVVSEISKRLETFVGSPVRHEMYRQVGLSEA